MHARFLLFLLPLLLAGCANIAYVGQAAGGQAEVMNRSRPIGEVIDDPDTPPALADKLRLARRIRAFAISALGLPDNASYTRYADLGRPYALWNVVSTPPLSLRPSESCFPIAGCLAYRGYYAEADAQRYADERRAAGEDVFLYGIPAYSTLGWFNDPLLNTTARYDETALARLIFHELAHQMVYVQDDSAFNEAFATAVELEGFERWLAERADPALEAGYRRAELRRAAFRALMEDGRRQLAAIYGSEAGEHEKLEEKGRVLAALGERYAALKAEWGGYLGYDYWFAPLPNNAHFASQSTYHDKVPAWRALFRSVGGDFPAFFAAARALAQKNKAARDETLAAVGVAAFSGERQQGAMTGIPADQGRRVSRDTR